MFEKAQVDKKKKSEECDYHLFWIFFPKNKDVHYKAVIIYCSIFEKYKSVMEETTFYFSC